MEVNKVTAHTGIDILRLLVLFVDKYRVDTDGGRSVSQKVSSKEFSRRDQLFPITEFYRFPSLSFVLFSPRPFSFPSFFHHRRHHPVQDPLTKVFKKYISGVVQQ